MTPPDWLERLDTSGCDAEGVVRALVVRNDGNAPFDGVGRLEVDFRTRATPPVRIETRDGAPVACRIDDEERGPVEADGKLRWRFTLRFQVAIAPRSIDAWRAAWGKEPGPALDATPRPELAAWERECVPGPVALPCAVDALDPAPQAGAPPPRSE